MILKRIFTCNLMQKYRFYSRTSATAKVQTLTVNDTTYKTDHWTNLTPRIQSYIDRNIYIKDNHPLSIVRQLIVDYFYKSFVTNRGNPKFTVLDNLSPVVTIQQNFDSLLIPIDHVSRKQSDSFYLNRDYMLRAHATAHQVDALKSGLDNFLIVGDVYRRDEIDATHFPIFHQIDAVRTIHRDKLLPNNANLQIIESNYESKKNFEPNQFTAEMPLESVCVDGVAKQSCHTLEAIQLIENEFKNVLVGLAQHLFGADIKFRWVNAYFPFTQPSWELEIWHNGKWMEVMGSGIMRNEILESSGIRNSIGWAFGIGLERLAMVLYNIPDIRLFWSTDTGFLCQFDSTKSTQQMQYRPVSKFMQCYMDVSFWLPDDFTLESFPVNSFYALVREIGGDIVEQVKLVDTFFHPKEGKNSCCFRIIYRHMEKHLTRDEVNIVHANIRTEAAKEFNVTLRI